jgi:two-component system sensor histidine kinase ChvG
MDRPQPRRWLSPLLRRILLLNALPPALLAATLLYLDQYQNGLLAAEVEGLRTQARIYSGAIAEAATRTQNDRPVLVPEISRPLLRRLVEPSPNTQARLFDTTGLLVADSRVREAAGGAIVSEPLPPPEPRGILAGSVVRLYDQLLRILPTGSGSVVQVDVNPDAPSFDWQPEFGQVPGQGGPDRREELRLALEGGVRPYIRRTSEGRLLVSVAEPAQRGNTSVGIVLLTREAREVDQRLLEVRISVLSLFGLALLLTVLLSLYLARTLATPILGLARAAAAMREGEGRGGSVPAPLLARNDEIGVLARDLQAASRALWARIDANERFAADVAHELRNPLTSVRSAIETLRRIEDQQKQRRLLSIISEDAVRMDRLINDIADSSRVDAELSRTIAQPVDVAPMLSAPDRAAHGDAGGGGPGGRAGKPRRGADGARRGGPAGAGVPQPAGQRTLLLAPARQGHRARPRRGQHRGGDGGGRRPRHPRGQAGKHLRPLLHRTPARRTLRPALGAGPVHLTPDRGRPARPHQRGKPARRTGRGDGSALHRAAAGGLRRAALRGTLSPAPPARRLSLLDLGYPKISVFRPGRPERVVG